MPASHLNEHIRSGRCAKQVQQNAAQRAARRTVQKEPKPAPTPTPKYPSWVLDVQPFDCGMCYQPIYRVLTHRGKERYYNDRELTERHRCTWPRDWDIDHP